jgi:hypothetical protein
MAVEQPNKEKVLISDLEDNVGKASELAPQEKARLVIAGWVLSVLAVIFVLSGGVVIFGPECRIKEAKEVFDFVKTIAPPIATLVIGFYFRSESA